MEHTLFTYHPGLVQEVSSTLYPQVKGYPPPLVGGSKRFQPVLNHNS